MRLPRSLTIQKKSSYLISKAGQIEPESLSMMARGSETEKYTEVHTTDNTE